MVTLFITTDASQGWCGGDRGQSWDFNSQLKSLQFAQKELGISLSLWVKEDDGDLSFECEESDRHGTISKS